MSDNVSGVLCFNKPAGITSHDVIYKVRRLYGTKQVGHTGTLDPLAEGVLVVMVGRAVKASEFLMAEEKEYQATLKLGLTTDTEDITGSVLSEYGGELPSFDAVKEAARKFTGNILQTPPMYSALKVDGRKLVDMARKGKEIEREARKITVSRLEVRETEIRGEFLLDMKVSKGTYVRTLCADIGKELGCGGVMKTLLRTSSGSFKLSESFSESDLISMSETERENALLPVETLFPQAPEIHLSEFFAKLALCGCEIYQKKIKTSYPADTLVRLYDESGFFALGKVSDFPDGSAIKPVKQFRI